jgi:hypothetical protein
MVALLVWQDFERELRTSILTEMKAVSVRKGK